MGGGNFEHLAGVVLFLSAVWFSGRLFKQLKLPGILGELLMGVVLGPNVLDVVPFASDGSCPMLTIGGGGDSGSSGRRLFQWHDAPPADHRLLASSSGSINAAADCRAIHVWNGQQTQDIWSFAGTLGVTMLIMESGMHINFEKVALVGGRAFIVAIIGTAAPMVMGMLLVCPCPYSCAPELGLGPGLGHAPGVPLRA